MIEKNIHLENLELTKNLFGNFDENIKLIENEFDVKLVCRDEELKIIGSLESVSKAQGIIQKLLSLASEGEPITRHVVKYFFNLLRENKASEMDNFSCDYVVITHKGKQIKVKTNGQKDYIQAIKRNDIVFGVGPAGTGKTFLAVAMAVSAYRNKDIEKIIITRPVVEAGEKLGFLPGDLNEKVDPYLRPINDALSDIMGYETYQKYITRNIIEIAPLAYMRGRTLENAFIILDEAQNTTKEQMKMFLTRLGLGSKAIITGDVTQIDLQRGVKSGLKDAIEVLKDIEGIEFMYLTDKDIVRHELVQKIIRAYADSNNFK